MAYPECSRATSLISFLDIVGRSPASWITFSLQEEEEAEAWVIILLFILLNVYIHIYIYIYIEYIIYFQLLIVSLSTNVQG